MGYFKPFWARFGEFYTILSLSFRFLTFLISSFRNLKTGLNPNAVGNILQ